MTRIGIDAMGGDHAPAEVVKGTLQACAQVDDQVRFVLFGDGDAIRGICLAEGFDPAGIDIVATSQTVDMGDHPAKAFQGKPDSSIVRGFQQLADGQIDAFASVGNTGAMMVGAMMVAKPIPGVIRPCIATHVPHPDGGDSLLLDVGINADCRPEMLEQYGLLGSLYLSEVKGTPSPKVALLNIGAEEGKGNALTKAAHELMSKNTTYDFVGNIEGSDLLRPGVADVVVTDGFTGNIVLKLLESYYKISLKRNIDDDYLRRFNYEVHGGTPILGVNKTIIIGHGVSKAEAVKNMALHTVRVERARLASKIAERIVQ